jgi:phage baseplate assembly protein V
MDVDSRNPFPRTKIGRDHQVRDSFRNGMVIERKFDKDRGPLVRVQYMDRQGLISYWLPVKQFGSRKTAHVYTPKIGDHVNVTMLQNGSENGFVDGSFFNKKNPPPEVDIDTRHFLTEDGTVIEYREKDSTFNMVSVGPVIVKGTTITIEGSESILEKAPTITLEGGQTVLITAPEITLNGHMTFNGDITHTGNMTTSGVHTDANGIHTGSRERERDLEAEVDALKAEVAGLKDRLWALEAKVRKGAGE